ncbi:MAG: Mut7-C ubiquitin/RNAse domain-containing protein [Spirochaetales bacterium]|nr:Mut7-C ubiquitin/RNAse domain-containing protein [Spirochaetales bacterium]
MIKVHIRFYEELNFFIRPEKRKQLIERHCKEGTTVKALIETCGIPHTEVDLVLVNGESRGFSYQLENNDRISVYPVFESFDIGKVSRVRPAPLRVIRFILDVHLGKLAKRLRLLGFDTLYSNTYTDEELSELSKKERRIILTRDTGLLKRKIITHGYYVRSRDPKEQLFEVIRRFDLFHSLKPFSRCIQCNEVLGEIRKDKIEQQLPDKVLEKYDRFYSCKRCNKIYWLGSHWKSMKKTLETISGNQHYL